MRPFVWAAVLVAATYVGCTTPLRPADDELTALLRDIPSQKKRPSNWSLVGDAQPPVARRRAQNEIQRRPVREFDQRHEQFADDESDEATTRDMAGEEIATILASLPVKPRRDLDDESDGDVAPRRGSRPKAKPTRSTAIGEPLGPGLEEALAIALAEARDLEEEELAARPPRRIRQASFTRERDRRVVDAPEEESIEDEPPRYAPSKSSATIRVETPSDDVENKKPKSAKTAAKKPAAKPADFAAENRRAIEALAEKIRKSRTDGADKAEIARLETLLRLHHLTAGDKDQALKPIDGLPAAEQEYWKHQLFELADMLSGDRMPGDRRRYALAMKSLEEAHRRLAELSSLSLQNAAFCKRVDDFGSVEKFDRPDFKKNQETLLYVEVANFAPKKVGDEKYETELQGSYRVLDRSGVAKAERTLPLDKQASSNARRDYYLAYRIFVPAELPPGAYTLELTIEDKKAEKSANTLLEFNVVP